MRKLNLILIMAIAAGFLQACHGSKRHHASTDSTIQLSSLAIADTANTKVNRGDVKFARKAAADGLTEIALAKLALQKSSDAGIKAFAYMIISAHSKANGELAQIAKLKTIRLSVKVDADGLQKIDNLSKLFDKGFDKVYIETMVDAHQDAVALMQAEAQNGRDADLKGFAGRMVAVVQAHLKAITKISDSL